MKDCAGVSVIWDAGTVDSTSTGGFKGDLPRTATVKATAEHLPISLCTRSWTELWECFNFRGIQAISVFCDYYIVIVAGLGMSEGEAPAITGAYGGAVYRGQPLGAWFADRAVPACLFVAVVTTIALTGHIGLLTIRSRIQPNPL